MFKVTYFADSPLNKDKGEVIEYESLTEMADNFRLCRRGPKKNSYFVRGELDPVVREDRNLKCSNLVILDIDKGVDNGCALSPLEMHELLVNLGYNHFIYTSHSHKVGDNRFRCVLESDRSYEKKDSKPTVDNLFKELHAQGCNAKNVYEHKNWSQPWFLPFRDDPGDGLYEFYSYHEGKCVSVVEGKNSALDEDDSASGSDSDEYADSKSWRERVREITHGINFHENIRNISWAMSNEGAPEQVIIMTIQLAMDMCHNQDERWEQRYKDIPRLVQGALDKQERDKRVNLDDIVISDGPVLRDIPWPPGLAGDLVEDAYMMERFRYREVALVSALGLLAGICGRKFNVSNTGLNLYLTLIMGTGMGKEQIRDFINGTLMSLGDKGQVTSSFIGPGKFNSFKSAIHSLKEARSQVCVFTEAGIMFKSAGDQASVTKALLHLYTCSGYNQYTIGESFSDVDKNVPVIRSPALSIISESTPESLLSVFMEQGAGQQGDLPRQSIFRLVGDKPRPEMFHQTGIREHLKKKLQALIKKCSEIQATDDYLVFNMLPADQEVQDDMQAFANHCVDMENQNREINTMRSYMYSRLFVKALKFAALASIMNYEDYPYIPMREWEWAKDLVNYEIEGLEGLFANSSSLDPLLDVAKNVVGRAIVKIMRGESKDPKLQLSKKDKDSGIILRSVLAYALKNNGRLKEYDTFNKFAPSARTGLDKVIKWMIDSGYLVEIESGRQFSKKQRCDCLKITRSFALLMS